MLRLVASVDLRCQDLDFACDVDHLDRQRLVALDELPARARVVVNVTGRKFVTESARHMLAQHLDRLDIQLEGDVSDLRRWHDYIVGERLVT